MLQLEILFFNNGLPAGVAALLHTIWRELKVAHLLAYQHPNEETNSKVQKPYLEGDFVMHHPSVSNLVDAPASIALPWVGPCRGGGKYVQQKKLQL